MNREIMQQALWALKDLIAVYPETACIETRISAQKVIAALKAELAKPEQEELIQFKDCKWSYVKKSWVGLTDDEVYEIANFCKDQPFNFYAKEIQTKLKEKNT